MEDLSARHRRRGTNRDGKILFLLILPFLVLTFLINYVPLFGWIYAFFDYMPGIPLSHTQFIGLQSFQAIFESGADVVRVLRNTLVLSLLGILLTPVPVIFAILLTEVRSNLFKKVIQTTTTLPYFISWVIVYALAFGMFSTDGLVNQILLKLGSQQTWNILGNANAVWIFQSLLGLWKYLGWNGIIYLAAIAGISGEMYDAAKVDGANRFQTIIHVTVPGISATFIVLLLLTVSNILSAGSSMDQYLVFNNPRVADSIEVLDLYVYKAGLITNDYSYATAVGILKSVISVLLLFLVNHTAKKVRGEGIV